MTKKINKQTLLSLTLIGLLIAIPILISGTIPIKENIPSQQLGITPPHVQSKAIFAGEEIDLRRMDLRERMDRELMSFSYMHSSSILIIKRANRYFPIIEPILKANNVPDDLKYLMVIESSLNPQAKSPAGAAGFRDRLAAGGAAHAGPVRGLGLQRQRVHADRPGQHGKARRNP